ncbi:MAG TPA: DNA recombination protein RmuC [Candidatus Binatia bacterium]
MTDLAGIIESVDVLYVAAAATALLTIVLLIVALRRPRRDELAPVLDALEQLRERHDRTESTVRDEGERNRREASSVARETREELARSLGAFGDSLHSRTTDIARLQQTQLEQFGQQLTGLLQTVEQRLDRLTESNEGRLERLRATVDERLGQMHRDNAEKLELVRQTVDERLHGTLEQRLGESFKQVSERLEQVHKGLGEMQSLASGVGDLKKVLSNVKTRGGWGEVQLAALLEQVLAPEQFDRNVRVREGTLEAVEFAIRLPGNGNGNGSREWVWLPIDAKFPLEDYQRLVDAAEAADREAHDAAVKALERRVQACAKDICVKYINPPRTTDFAIMFLPTEGLYAEVARRVGLLETLQRDHRVVVAGPSTFVALLNSLQMGFRTLAIQERSSEVWKLLGAVKTEFRKFGEVLDGVKKKLDQASTTMEQAARRSRAIERKLRDVEQLPMSQAQALLGDASTLEELDEAV